MKALKRFFAILLMVVLVLGMIALHFIQKREEQNLSASIQSIQQSIRMLEAEKQELEAKLVEIGADGADAGSENEEAYQTESMQAVLCVVNVTETFYEDVFPVMQEDSQTGVIILRDGRLPGDVTDDIISVSNFVNMINAGWSYAITVTQYPNTSTESWTSSIEQYMEHLIARVGIKPSMYYFADSVDEESLSILQDEGFETVLCHNMLENTALKVVQLIPYNSDLVVTTMSQMDGYCGLEVWASWEDNTNENLQYSKDRILQLMENESIALSGMDQLKALTAAEEGDKYTNQFDLEKYATEGQIKSRIAEIEAEIDQLYR